MLGWRNERVKKRKTRMEGKRNMERGRGGGCAYAETWRRIGGGGGDKFRR